MKRPRVLLDADGVLADFLGQSLDVLAEISGQKWHIDQFKTWDIFETVPSRYEKVFFETINQLGWCRSLPVYPEAVAGVTRLREIAEIYIVTSPMNHIPTWMFERERWVEEHFGIHHKKVVHTSAKYLCTADVLIDDRPANIQAWEREHPEGLGLLWDQPYNRGEEVGLRVQSWAQVHAVVENLQDVAAFKQGKLPW